MKSDNDNGTPRDVSPGVQITAKQLTVGVSLLLGTVLILGALLFSFAHKETQPGVQSLDRVAKEKSQ